MQRDYIASRHRTTAASLDIMVRTRQRAIQNTASGLHQGAETPRGGGLTGITPRFEAGYNGHTWTELLPAEARDKAERVKSNCYLQ